VAREWVQHVLRAVRRPNDTLFVTTKDLFLRAKCHTANSLLDAAGQLMSHNKTLVAYCMHKKQFVWHSVTARVTQQEVDVGMLHDTQLRRRQYYMMHSQYTMHRVALQACANAHRSSKTTVTYRGTQPCPHTCR
jgi:hypothetical protein